VEDGMKNAAPHIYLLLRKLEVDEWAWMSMAALVAHPALRKYAEEMVPRLIRCWACTYCLNKL
jgi:hypothetical protein